MSTRQLAERTGITEAMLVEIEAGRVPLTGAQIEALRAHPVFQTLFADGDVTTGPGGNGHSRGTGRSS